jgi:hypothetical protein
MQCTFAVAGSREADSKKPGADENGRCDPQQQSGNAVAGLRVYAGQSAQQLLALELLVGFGLDHFATAIVAGRADVVTQVRLARSWLDCQRGVGQEIMRAMHTAF